MGGHLYVPDTHSEMRVSCSDCRRLGSPSPQIERPEGLLLTISEMDHWTPFI